MVNIEKRMKLKGVLERTASSVEIKGDGSLVVELYDFSNEAEQRFGNDVAFLLKVSAANKSRMLSCLMSGQNEMAGSLDRDELLLQLLKEQFADYYAVKQWLEQNKIPFQQEFDSWA